MQIVTRYDTQPHQAPSGCLIAQDSIMFFKCARVGETFDHEAHVLETLAGDCAPRFIGCTTLFDRPALLTEHLPYPTVRQCVTKDCTIKHQVYNTIIREYQRLNAIYGYVHEDPHQDNVL